MKAILQDRYGGAYSGGKWLVVEDYHKLLTLKELNLVNEWIREVNLIYGSTVSNGNNGLEELGSYNVLSKPTRLQAVERVLQGSDLCAAEWDFEALPWVLAVNDLRDLCEKTESEKFKQLVEDFGRAHWVDIYQREDHHD